jgi:AcrR family transcriptional regulator
MARKPALVGTDRRQQILEAALDVFAEQGLEGATTKEIAARAGVTPGLIYFYFPGKQELFFATFELQARQVLSQLDLSDEAISDEPPERVMRRVVSRFVQAMDSPRSASLLRILMRESMRCESAASVPTENCEARTQIRQIAEQLSTSMRDYFLARMERGKLRALNATIVAELFAGALIRLLLRRVSGDGSLVHLSREELTDTIVSLFLYGVLPAGAGCATGSEAALENTVLVESSA